MLQFCNSVDNTRVIVFLVTRNRLRKGTSVHRASNRPSNVYMYTQIGKKIQYRFYKGTAGCTIKFKIRKGALGVQMQFRTQMLGTRDKFLLMLLGQNSEQHNYNHHH